MKRFIFILLTLLILTGCSRYKVEHGRIFAGSRQMNSKKGDEICVINYQREYVNEGKFFSNHYAYRFNIEIYNHKGKMVFDYDTKRPGLPLTTWSITPIDISERFLFDDIDGDGKSEVCFFDNGDMKTIDFFYENPSE